MHAFPSNQDADSLMQNAESTKKGASYLIVLPFIALIKLANAASFLWFDLIYAMGISVGFPYLLLVFLNA